jgi:hypothetical protein
VLFARSEESAVPWLAQTPGLWGLRFPLASTSSWSEAGGLVIEREAADHGAHRVEVVAQGRFSRPKYDGLVSRQREGGEDQQQRQDGHHFEQGKGR